ncbi:MPN086 family protein, partial [Mycoplasmoides pneumoniae]
MESALNQEFQIDFCVKNKKLLKILANVLIASWLSFVVFLILGCIAIDLFRFDLYSQFFFNHLSTLSALAWTFFVLAILFGAATLAINGFFY